MRPETNAMLQHESQEPTATTPAAQIRVTSEELTEAINALQASKDEAARRLAGTVPIGDVVKELNLDATPEEVWAQVQKQRQAAAEKAASEKVPGDAPKETFHRAAREARDAAAQAIVAAQAAAQAASAHSGAHIYARPRRRWRGKWLAILGIGWAFYGIAHGNLIHRGTSTLSASQSITVNGDNQMQTYNAEGKDVVINGDACTVTLHGRALSVTVNGDNDRVIGDTAQSVETNGDNDTVTWNGAPAGVVTDSGHGNHITVTNP